MPEKHFLLKVLGLSGLPKLATFVLTLVSFPILIRAVGAENYGVILFIGSALGLFEVLVNFGIASAAAKSIVAARTYDPSAIFGEFFIWVKLQLLFLLFGFGPMVLAAYLLLNGSPIFEDGLLFLVMSVTVIFSAVLNFIRPNLQSLLAFRSLAVLDVSESVFRSTGYIFVAFLYPNPLGLAFSLLGVAILSSLLAVVLIAICLCRIRAKNKSLKSENVTDWPGRHLTLKSRLQESANFLWLRLTTRVFQEGPIFFLGRLIGAEVVGVVGAFRKISEILSTPYLVIGNALMVRVQEVAQLGLTALTIFWNSSMRILSTSLIFAILIFLLAEPLSNALLPESAIAPTIFTLMSPLIFLSAISGMIAPMSDYMGGLLVRNWLLTISSIIQILLMWILANVGTYLAAVGVMVVVYAIMVSVYILIAYQTLFGNYRVRVQKEVALFSSFIVSSGVISYFMFVTDSNISVTSPNDYPFAIILYLLTVLTFVLSISSVRKIYVNAEFFELT